MTWKLEELYITIEECYESFEKIDSRVENLRRYFDTTFTKENLKSILDEFFVCKELANKALVYGSLMFYKDAKNEQMIELKRTVEKKNADVTAALVPLEEKLANLEDEEFRILFESNDELADYRQFVFDLKRRKKHTITTDRKTSLQNGIDDLLKKYNDILTNISLGTISVEGKEVELTHANAAKFLAARDGETRKNAFESLNKAYEAKANELADILNEIYATRVEICRIEGYRTVEERALDNENIPATVIDNLLKAVHQNREYLQRYMRAKAKFMNIDGPHLYDLGVPLDFDIKRDFPLEKGLELAKWAFDILGSEYSAVVDDLINRGHIDAVPDDRKHQTITFSWMGYSFLNYHDSYNDLKNLVHEIGHSINDSLSINLLYPYRISSLFAGETASITNEILLNRSLLDHAETDEERCFYLAKEIDNFITSVYRQALYTELEHILYSKAERGEVLDADTIGTTYLNLLKQYYGEDIVYDDLSAFEWTRLGKLFRWSYYSYNYATGLLIANSIYSKLKDGSLPVQKYIDFLASGSKEYSIPLLETVGIDLTNDSVWNRGFEVLKDDIVQLEKFLTVKEKQMTLQEKNDSETN